MAVLVLAGLAAPGCSSAPVARYVYQDGQFGVIGLPENTSFGSDDYLSQAHALMARHFPDGYEIVRAEEVVEGSRTLTVKGANAAEIDAAGPTQVLSLAKLGRTTSRSQSDSLKIKECRILYKKSEGGGIAHKSGEYADQAAWSPGLYIDPNAPERRLARTKPGEEARPGAPGHESLAKAPHPGPAVEPPEVDEPVFETTKRTPQAPKPKPPGADHF